jgi:hypothetical protein
MFYEKGIRDARQMMKWATDEARPEECPLWRWRAVHQLAMFDVLNIKEAAFFINKPVADIREAIGYGELRGRKINGAYFITRLSLVDRFGLPVELTQPEPRDPQSYASGTRDNNA